MGESSKRRDDMLPGLDACLDSHKLDMLSFLPNGIFFPLPPVAKKTAWKWSF